MSVTIYSWQPIAGTTPMYGSATAPYVVTLEGGQSQPIQPGPMQGETGRRRNPLPEQAPLGFAIPERTGRRWWQWWRKV